jgi:hypothetical protein
VITVVDGRLTGEDYVGGKYTGTATEQPDGTIKLSTSFEVRPGRGLVVGTSAQDLPYSRAVEAELPPAFGNGAPQQIELSPGSVTIMFKRIPDDLASWATEGFRLEKGRQN